ncbi:unnamed protein product [Auanema sp. JU1783]|nr:unnamed protein product [Auanema sp. JU1783]
MDSEEFIPSRRNVDDFEIVFLSIMTAVAVVLNFMLLTQILTTSRQPTVRTSFSTGPYQLNSFTLFKLNLCISDFFILCFYSLGKIIWLITYQWRLGDVGCRMYQFFSAFGFYAHSNIIVAIALDRLKVVYTRHLQGATSVRRVRMMLFCSWALAALCSIPQAILWTNVEIRDGWHQCVNLLSEYENNTEIGNRKLLAITYEAFHQANVFWIPVLIIGICYMLIIFKLIHYSIRTKEAVRVVRSNEFDHRENSSSQEVMLSPSKQMKKKNKWPIIHSIATSSSDFGDFKKSNTCIHSQGLQRCRSLPAWRRQLRSRVFRSAMAVIAAHIALWLPYNALATLRFIDEHALSSMSDYGGNFLEDLIVVNSVLNPILYGFELRKAR